MLIFFSVIKADIRNKFSKYFKIGFSPKKYQVIKYQWLIKEIEIKLWLIDGENGVL